MAERPIKLTPTMKKVIQKMRVGDGFQTFFDKLNGWWICEGDSYLDRTMEALLKRGIIKFRSKFSGNLQYCELTDLGKTIQL